ncbi:glutamate carboxypeptidase [Altererythrobacter atlanticus]|uniref:Carboxypeptidase G2 n=1 Tax=Croceibacterium atlanticum TaxID=1267766 RepID=A0A0F7KSQ9_9SPHN|nr:hydrolase [Croceibacterium atlanticum]AKH42176.1 Carboxypeptidase G2 precursor [Croceibacterium atlanticum]MBB5734011.1 glutamate carboxypeptidase [Croceibacterium atlanticum]
MKQLTTEERSLGERIDQASMLAQTERWSAINSGTRHLAGLAMQAQELADAFSVLPGEIELRHPAPVTAMNAEGHEEELEHGRHLILRVRPDAPRRLLLTGHMDTVYPVDHPFQQGVWLDEDTLNAPGAADMKGGLSVILAALRAFEASDAAGAVGYDVMINSDEETGSLSSSSLIAELARGKHAALTYEPSTLPDGTLAHARGGSGNFSVVITGQSAHAGRNPQDGRNAIVAAAALAVALKDLQHDGLSVNPAKIEGGSANNVVPDHAILRFNIRPKSEQAAQEFNQSFHALLRDIAETHEVGTRVHGGISRPPKPVDAKAQRLFDLVCDTSEALGRKIGWKPTGGVCDGNNIAACGVPVVDTMGVRGGNIHSPEEYLIASSLSERAMLSAVVLHRLAKGVAL